MGAHEGHVISVKKGSDGVPSSELAAVVSSFRVEKRNMHSHHDWGLLADERQVLSDPFPVGLCQCPQMASSVLARAVVRGDDIVDGPEARQDDAVQAVGIGRIPSENGHVQLEGVRRETYDSVLESSVNGSYRRVKILVLSHV